MTYTDPAKTALSISETSEPATFIDTKQGQLTINGKTDEDEGSTFVIKSVIQDRDGTRFRIFQNIVVFIYKSDVNLDVDKEWSKMKNLL